MLSQLKKVSFLNLPVPKRYIAIIIAIFPACQLFVRNARENATADM
jgi:hypothetical protein